MTKKEFVLIMLGGILSLTILNILTAMDVMAADISIKRYDTGRHFIAMEGTIEAGDFYRLKIAWDGVKAGEMVDLQLHSPGGSEDEMKKISEWVAQQSNLQTVVSSNSYCYSACATIWAHGVTKWAGSEADIGFHVSSMAVTPKAVEWLDKYHHGYGWQGIQQLVQDNYAESLQYYFEMPVDSPAMFVAQIGMASGGQNFWMLTPENAWVIGSVNYY